MTSKINTNDKMIMELKKQIEDKKKALKATERFQPLTNCSIELNGVRSNIQVLAKENLVQLLTQLNAYRKSAEELGLLDDYYLSGFHIDEWIVDLKAKLMNLTRKIEEDRLKSLENKLHTLLSGEKKIELEIDAIKKLL